VKYRKKPIVIEATQWFKNGDHPRDNCFRPFEDTGEVPISAREGKIVRYFRHPNVSGDAKCDQCNHIMHDHGWIDTLEGGHTVCYGDWIITGIKGEHYPCKPDIFEATYDSVKTDEINSTTEEELLEQVSKLVSLMKYLPLMKEKKEEKEKEKEEKEEKEEEKEEKKKEEEKEEEEEVKTIDDIDQEKETAIAEWYQKAKECRSTEELKNFLDIILDYKLHDYNSITDAFIAGLLATMKAMDCHDNGGITGYQASWIVIQFITKELRIDGPWRIQKYGNMLYPQYSGKFEKTISKDTWDFLQKEADKNLGTKFGHPDVVAHWRSIVDGIIPFGWKLDDYDGKDEAHF